MVKRLMTHYAMYAKSNTTDIDTEVTKDWEEFLQQNTEFIYPFDFVKVYLCILILRTLRQQCDRICTMSLTLIKLNKRVGQN